MAAMAEGGLGLPRVFAVLLCSFSLTFSYGTSDSRHLFTDHAVVYPSLYSARDKRELSPNKVLKEEVLNLVLLVFNNKSLNIELRINKELLPQHYFEKHHEDGETIMNWPIKKDESHCHYQGHLNGCNSSWAAISVCYGISGCVYDGEELYYIEPDKISEIRHFVYRASDLKPQNFSCGVSADESIPRTSSLLNGHHRSRRATILQEPYRSTSKSRFVELVIVNDHSEFKKFNRSKEVVFERTKQIANIVNALYSPLNIYIALVGVVIWSERDEIKLSSDGDETLTNFLHYRQQRLVREHPNDNAQLITAMTFEGSVLGKALKGPICSFKYSGGINMDHSSLVALVATTVTHELAHNLGFEHDSDECKCPDDKCIMAPSSSSTSPKHWSSCSLEYLDAAFSQGMDYCLINRPVEIVGPVCGNGFLEDGEDCDCGLQEFSDNHCCNASTCKLFSNATCAMGGCCDMETCEIKKTATICREAASECDFPEYCNGQSEICPTDTYFQNGESCGNQKAFCYEGKCASHADQCKLLWGETGKVSDPACYEQNYKGNINGNCGYNRVNDSYKTCNKKDVLCGMLHCSYQNERLAFGMESAATLIRSYVNVRGKVFICRSAIVDFGLYNADPGMVPNGAKCGEEKVCINQKCVPVLSVKKAECSLQCSGNGICNNKGNCHCAKGFGPPFCNTPGPGGSVDSGPASDAAGYVLVVIMYVIFLGLVPLIVITAASLYYFQPYLKTWWIAKARKANIKCRQNVTRKPQLPSKFNFDRSSLRTLEISLPIQTTTATKPPGSLSGEKDKVALNSCAPDNVIRNLSTDFPVPVRPAPPRPDVTPKITSPLTKPTESMKVVRTCSLKTNECGFLNRPLSTSLSRPNCPPPRPPLPKASYTSHSKICSSSPREIKRSITPNSTYYDDCETLDFSDTPLAFVHQKSPQMRPMDRKSFNQEGLPYSNICEQKTVNPKQIVDATNIRVKNNSNSTSATVSQLSVGGMKQPSVVATLAKRFESHGAHAGSEIIKPSEMRVPFKTRPLPPNNTQLS